MKKWSLLLSLSLFFSTYIQAENKVQTKSIQQSQTYQISAHVLDIHRGFPAENIIVDLYKSMNDMHTSWTKLDTKRTNINGYIGNFLPKTNKSSDGVYKFVFHSGDYQYRQGVVSMYPYIEVAFKIENNKHYHIPLLLSGNGFSPMVLTR